MSNPSYHTDLLRKFDAASDASQKARADSERARDYYDGKQLTGDQIEALKKRKQPIVIENRIRPKIDYLCGLERQSRTDPKAYPRTASHTEDADAVTDALRYVSDDQDYPIKRSRVFQDMLVEGFGGVEIVAEQTRRGIDPAIKELPWDRLFYDPHSSRVDFSDAAYMGYVTWLDIEDAKRRWPEASDVLEATTNRNGAGVLDETLEDKPRWKSWVDSTRRRVRIVTIYDRSRGQWERCVFTLAGELEPCAPSPFVDEDGQPANAMILQAAYVDRDNDRYGIVRDYVTLQDEVNKRRSKFLHLANSRQLRISPALGMSADAAKREAADPSGVFIAEAGEVDVVGTGDMAQGHFALLAEAKEAINSVGPNATMQGKSGQDQSGRAILALQQGGMTEVAPLLDALRHFNIRVYRAIWDRVRQFWTEERWVRVTDDERNIRFVGLNTTKGKLAMLKLDDAVKAGKVDPQQADMLAFQIASDPAMQAPANVLSDVDADIVLEEVQDTATAQFEQFDQLTKLYPASPDHVKPAMFQGLIEASTLRNKQKILDILEKGQQPPPGMEQAQQLQQAAAMAEVEKTQSETALNAAKAEEIGAKVQLEAFKTGAGIPQGMAA